MDTTYPWYDVGVPQAGDDGTAMHIELSSNFVHAQSSEVQSCCSM